MTTELINGQLPSDWELVEIGQKFTFTTKPKGLNFEDREIIPFAPMERIPSDRLYFSDFVLKTPQEISSGTYFEDGDLLLSKITPCFENGKQGIATKIPKGFGIATTEVIPIKAIEGVSYLPFLAMYLLDRGVRNSLAGKMEGATGRQRLAKSVLKGWIMPFPPLPEQRAIVAVLSKIQAAMEVQDKIVATLKELKAATMAKLFREGLRGEPLKQTEIGQMPESWEVVQLREISKLITKGSSPNWQGFEYCEKGVLFVRSQNIGLGELLLSDVTYLPEEFNKKERRSILSSGDILINIVGASIGRAAVADEHLRGANINQAVALVRIPPGNENSVFLMYFLISQGGLDQMHRQKKEIARANLSLEDVGSFFVPVPAREEQDKIADALESINKRLNMAERKRDLLKSVFSSMLHLLMTGRVRVIK